MLTGIVTGVEENFPAPPTDSNGWAREIVSPEDSGYMSQYVLENFGAITDGDLTGYTLRNSGTSYTLESADGSTIINLRDKNGNNKQPLISLLPNGKTLVSGVEDFDPNDKGFYVNEIKAQNQKFPAEGLYMVKKGEYSFPDREGTLNGKLIKGDVKTYTEGELYTLATTSRQAAQGITDPLTRLSFLTQADDLLRGGTNGEKSVLTFFSANGDSSVVLTGNDMQAGSLVIKPGANGQQELFAPVISTDLPADRVDAILPPPLQKTSFTLENRETCGRDTCFQTVTYQLNEKIEPSGLRVIDSIQIREQRGGETLSTKTVSFDEFQQHYYTVTGNRYYVADIPTTRSIVNAFEYSGIGQKFAVSMETGNTVVYCPSGGSSCNLMTSYNQERRSRQIAGTTDGTTQVFSSGNGENTLRINQHPPLDNPRQISPETITRANEGLKQANPKNDLFAFIKSFLPRS